MSEIKMALPVTENFRVAVSQWFGENPADYKKFNVAGHTGIDFAVPIGTPIYCALDGVVKTVKFDAGGYGNYVVVSHLAGSLETWYCHLDNSVVSVGQLVNQGQMIGRSGSTGNSTGPHLHFGVWTKGRNDSNGYAGFVDPKGMLGYGVPEPVPEAPIISLWPTEGAGQLL